MSSMPGNALLRRTHPVTLETNPNERKDPMFSGLSVAALARPTYAGTIGCFIHTPGDPARGIDEGDYLLTCQHVLKYANRDDDSSIIQPWSNDPPRNYFCGDYVAGVDDAGHDCAIVRVHERRFQNKVPDAPGHFGYRTIRGVGQAVVGMAVYKFGTATRFTRGRVTAVGQNVGGRLNCIRIEGTELPDEIWAGPGDSGSAVISEEGDLIVGINFAVPEDASDDDPSRLAYAFPIQSQMDYFSANGGVRLAGL